MRRALLVLLLGITSADLSAAMVEIGVRPSKASAYFSIYRVLAVPDQLDGRDAMVTGYLIASFEGSSICATREDVDNFLLQNCVYLDLDWEELGLTQEFRKLNGRIVNVAGVIRPVSARQRVEDRIAKSGAIERLVTYLPLYAAKLEQVSYLQALGPEEKGKDKEDGSDSHSGKPRSPPPVLSPGSGPRTPLATDNTNGQIPPRRNSSP